MKIFLVTPFLPHQSATHAGGILIYQSIKALSEGNNDVTLLSRVDPSEIKDVADISRFCKQVHLYPSRYDSNIISKILSYVILGMKANRLVRRNFFDIIHVEYTETGIALKRPGIPSMLVAQDVITKPAKRRFDASRGAVQHAVNFLKLKVIERLERFISKKFDMILVMSDSDRKILLSLDKNIRAEVSTSPLGLSFGPVGVKVERESRSLLFCGAMHRGANAEAALYFYKNILPLVRKVFPDAKFYVVGNNPPRALIELAEKDTNLIVTGFVESMDEYFLKASVFVSPILIGGGIIVKNLKAMSYAVPVVTTTIGNEGIGAADGTEVFVADSAEIFAERIVRLFKNPELQSRIGKNGRMLAEQKFSDARLFERRMSFYKELLGKKPV